MSQKSSTFVRQTRERETWLTSSEGIDPLAAEQSLSVAALTRGVLDGIKVPDEAEELSRARAVAELQDLQLRRNSGAVHAPWYLRLGHALRYVFTLGRRR